MKREKQHRVPWYIPPPPSSMATIQCRSCGAALTGQLRRLDDSTVLASKELTPLVPAGCFWPVAADHLPTIADDGPVDFTGCYAVQADELIGVGNHPDRKRWIGCCGPSGTGGPNRVCSCGRAVGTERSDCMWPVAVYLDPQSVCLAETKAEQ